MWNNDNLASITRNILVGRIIIWGLHMIVNVILKKEEELENLLKDCNISDLDWSLPWKVEAMIHLLETIKVCVLNIKLNILKI